MSIEQTLERIAVALEKLVGGPGAEVVPVALVQAEKTEAPKAKKAKKEATANELFDEEPAEAKLVVSEESVREIVKKYAEAESPEKAMELLKKFKVKRLRELKPEQFSDVIAVFGEALGG